MADINVEMLKDKLYQVASALFCIGETCVDVSKMHISEKDAINKIRACLCDTDVIGSRYRVDRLIEYCMEPVVSNTLEETNNDWLNKYLREQPLQTFEINYPACCDGCSNNPKNGGSGICNCTLPYMHNPTNYTVPIGDFCMANNTNGYVYFVDDINSLTKHKAGHDRIAKAIENTKKYIKE